MISTLKSGTWMTGNDLNVLLLEKEQKLQRKNCIIIAYDVNCYFPPYEILCILEGDSLLNVNLSNSTSGNEIY